MVNINDVVAYLKEDFLPDEYDVSVQETTKNNGIKRQGILINGGKMVSPIIYVDNLIEQGMDAKEIAISVLEQYKKMKENEVPIDVYGLSDFSEMKKLICYRLINAQANKKLLEKAPFEKINDDLALVYFLDLGNDATITITNTLVDIWGIDSDDLFEIASDNTPLRYPPELKSMADVMVELLGDEIEIMKIEFGKSDLDDDDFKEFLKTEMFSEDVPLYVLRGREQYGATALVYDDMIPILQERFSECFILPSSVHEILVAPADKVREQGLNAFDLKNMISQVNEQMVSAEDRLSDNLYIINKDGFMLAEDRNEPIIDDDAR